MREEGRRSGMMAMLLQTARLRFGGGFAGRLASLLKGISDTDRLRDIGEWVGVCERREALLARLRGA